MESVEQINFSRAASNWLCDNYSIDIRYLAIPNENGAEIIFAKISMNPLGANFDHSFDICTDNIVAGQFQKYPVEKSELELILQNALKGVIYIDSRKLQLSSESTFDFFSEMNNADRWFSDLHIQISGKFSSARSVDSLSKINNDLRIANPPFDGLEDVAGWLGFEKDSYFNGRSNIAVRIGPPVDLIHELSFLHDDNLKLVMHAHPSFDLRRLQLSVRGVPGKGLLSRLQIGESVEWNRVSKDRIEGIVNINIENCDSVLAMILISGETVRRHWILDSKKARNNRYMAVQNFDSDLRQVRRFLLESADSDKFEKAIAALFFLLGFSPVLLLETDAPDLIVATPGGELIIIECTIKVADIFSKIGKLVDRRVSLQKALKEAGHPFEIVSILVCRLSQDQISVAHNDIRANNVLLITKEYLEDSLAFVRHPLDPDEIVKKAKERFQSSLNLFSLS